MDKTDVKKMAAKEITNEIAYATAEFPKGKLEKEVEKEDKLQVKDASATSLPKKKTKAKDVITMKKDSKAASSLQ